MGEVSLGDEVEVWIEPQFVVSGRVEATLDHGRILVTVPDFIYVLRPKKRLRKAKGGGKPEKPEPEFERQEVGKREGEFKLYAGKWHLMCYRRERL